MRALRLVCYHLSILSDTFLHPFHVFSDFTAVHTLPSHKDPDHYDYDRLFFSICVDMILSLALLLQPSQS